MFINYREQLLLWIDMVQAYIPQIQTVSMGYTRQKPKKKLYDEGYSKLQLECRLGG